MQWAIDIVKLPRESGGYLLVMGDVGSGEIVLVTKINSTTENSISEALAASFEERHPSELLVDHVGVFHSESVGELFKRKGIKLKLLSPYSASVRGAVERMIRRALTEHRPNQVPPGQGLQ